MNKLSNRVVFFYFHLNNLTDSLEITEESLRNGSSDAVEKVD